MRLARRVTSSSCILIPSLKLFNFWILSHYFFGIFWLQRMQLSWNVNPTGKTECTQNYSAKVIHLIFYTLMHTIPVGKLLKLNPVMYTKWPCHRLQTIGSINIPAAENVCKIALSKCANRCGAEAKDQKKYPDGNMDQVAKLPESFI